jgi:ubiquinone/menaquinone biosynthesis C-methylase UbiE
MSKKLMKRFPKNTSERLILDIGSGDNPHADATHLCDLYISSNRERMRDIVIDERPFVLCCAEHLPFRSDAFVFAYACHVLEHTSEPAMALREITRVARKGYIETPTSLSERIYGWDFHKWAISFKKGRIFFSEKPTPQKIVNMHRLYRNNTAVRLIDNLVELTLGWHYVKIVWNRSARGIVLNRVHHANVRSVSEIKLE